MPSIRNFLPKRKHHEVPTHPFALAFPSQEKCTELASPLEGDAREKWRSTQDLNQLCSVETKSGFADASLF
jgi:hypothetical protein